MSKTHDVPPALPVVARCWCPICKEQESNPTRMTVCSTCGHTCWVICKNCKVYFPMHHSHLAEETCPDPLNELVVYRSAYERKRTNLPNHLTPGNKWICTHCGLQLIKIRHFRKHCHEYMWKCCAICYKPMPTGWSQHELECKFFVRYLRHAKLVASGFDPTLGGTPMKLRSKKNNCCKTAASTTRKGDEHSTSGRRRSEQGCASEDGSASDEGS